MIKNYSTTISAERTAGEITALLARKGASSITTEYVGLSLSAITFIISVAGMPVRFCLPSNPEGVAKAMLRERPYTSRMRGWKADYEAKVREQAKWVSWRIVKDWVEAQLALIESGQGDIAQVFMPYALEPNGSDKTMFQLWMGTYEQKALGSGSAA